MNEALHHYLEQKFARYNQPDFIENDPICIPHQFSKKEDIEIAGFIAALLAWGQRKTIVSKSKQLMNMMGNSPHEFLLNATQNDFKPMLHFKHRTFNGEDCITLLQALANLYQHHGGLETTFTEGFSSGGAYEGIELTAKSLLQFPHLPHFGKHLARPSSGSAAKRINMFLRWMVRRDAAGVDFGLWKGISPSQLVCPLDVHSGKVARWLGLLQRRQNDWRAATELTSALCLFDRDDPVKYDFALFGSGIANDWLE